jgi:hypothetical protein
MAVEPFGLYGGLSVGIPPILVIDDNGRATLNGLTVSGTSNLGPIGNITITGGENGYFLQTDGEGRLTWAPSGNGGNGGNGIPGGANTQVQFNDQGNFGGDAGFRYNKTSNILYVSGNIETTNFTATGNIVVANIVASSNVTANYFIGDGSQVTNVDATTANSANYAGNVTVAAQPNITSLGTLTSLTVTGNVSANYFLGNGALLTGIANSNFAPTSNFANFAGNVTLSSQPNITSLGTLINVSVSGNANIGNLKANLVTGNLIPATSNLYTLGNSTNRWKDIYLAGNSVYLGNVVLTADGNSLVINGGNGNIISTNLSNVPAANIVGQVANALVSSTVYTNAQPNITSVGTLTTLAVSGNTTSNNLAVANTLNSQTISVSGTTFTTNLNVTGTATFSNNAVISSAALLTVNGNLNATGSANVTLGNVANIHITGGLNGYVLSTDGAGNLSWTAGGGNGGGNGVPGGSNTQVQYNDNGLFGGSAFLTFNENTNTFQVAGNLVANSTQIGAGVYKFSTSSVYAATTSSTAANQLLWSTEAANVSGIDFHIISTDLGSGTRQVSKISSVILGNIVQWNEYGSLLINGGVGSFDVAYTPGNVVVDALIELRVTPDSTNVTSYKILITEYTP